MNRRDFFKLSLLVSSSSLFGATYFNENDHIRDYLFLEKNSKNTYLFNDRQESSTPKIKKIIKPKKDIIASHKELGRIKSLYSKLRRVQKVVGYGHFNILSFDGMVSLSKNIQK